MHAPAGGMIPCNDCIKTYGALAHSVVACAVASDVPSKAHGDMIYKLGLWRSGPIPKDSRAVWKTRTGNTRWGCAAVAPFPKE